ncbi:MAG: hypothetical protein ACFB2Z_13455 [Maricaulaceae bacterium]
MKAIALALGFGTVFSVAAFAQDETGKPTDPRIEVAATIQRACLARGEAAAGCGCGVAMAFARLPAEDFLLFGDLAPLMDQELPLGDVLSAAIEAAEARGVDPTRILSIVNAVSQNAAETEALCGAIVAAAPETSNAP